MEVRFKINDELKQKIETKAKLEGFTKISTFLRHFIYKKFNGDKGD